MLEPLDTVSARTAVRRIVKEGTVTFTNPHSRDAMKDDGLEQIEFEYDDDAAAERADELVVVTVWRCR
ncbi:MAG: hypothetical protein GXP55_16005 [Deltaproteobacteria bacterium]|nr:hypothetical protein [Deltaproteobacteria bacterium]